MEVVSSPSRIRWATQVPNGKNDASDAQKATNSAWWMVKAPSRSFFQQGYNPQKVAENIHGSNWVFVHP